MSTTRKRKSAKEIAEAGAKRARLSTAPMYSPEPKVFSRGHYTESEDKPWAALGAWFLGPKAENGDVFQNLLTKAVESHIKFRHR